MRAVLAPVLGGELGALDFLSEASKSTISSGSGISLGNCADQERDLEGVRR